MGLQLVTTDATSSPLTTDGGDGLQVAVDRCSVAWSLAGPSATCAGTTTAVAADGPVLGRFALPSAGSAALVPGGVDHLRLVLRLPTTAPSTLQGRSAALMVSVVGVQRRGVQR